MATFHSIQDPNDNLTINAGNLIFAVAPFGSALPTSICAPDGSLEPLPSGWISGGMVQKQAGVTITPNVETQDIEGYGKRGPRRTLKTKEGIELEISPHEARAVNYSLFWGKELGDHEVNPDGQAFIRKSYGEVGLPFYSVLLIGHDKTQDTFEDIYPYFIFPKMTVTNPGEQSWDMESELLWPITLTAYEDDDLEYYVESGLAGPGAASHNAAAGFGS